MKLYKRFKETERLEFILWDWFQWGNSNNALIHFFFTYGHSNGYTNEFTLNILCPWNWGWGKSVHNGHNRIHFACGLFSVYFDYLDKKSIIHAN